MNPIRHLLLRFATLALILASPVSFAALPSDATTGPTTLDTQLRQISGLTITQDGTVLENFSSTGTITIDASNVTLRNFKITTSGSYGIHVSGGSNILIEDGEISGMESAGIYGGGFTARRLHVHDSGNDAFKPTSNVVIEDSYVERLGYIDTAHADGVQMVSGSNVTIRRNNFRMPSGEPGFKNSQVIIIQTNNGPVDNILIEENWINGGGYSIQIRDKQVGYGAPTNVRIRNNRFGTDYQFGPWVLDGDVELCGNVWDLLGTLLNSQATCSSGSPPAAGLAPVPPVLISVK